MSRLASNQTSCLPKSTLGARLHLVLCAGAWLMYLMREALSGQPSQSVLGSAHQCQSVLISGHQWSSVHVGTQSASPA